MRTQVGIVGAGPAGLLLSHLLARAGIESVVLETRSREYVQQRVRAGVLEHPTVELLREVGLADRLDREGMPHEGISLRFEGVDHRIDFTDLVGRGITVYGQQEVVKDLIAARLADGGDLRFEVSDVTLDGLADAPVIGYTDAGGQRHELRCDVVAGCDGFHGISRGAYNPEVFDREYPYAWLGILAKAAPTQHELAYASHPNGFALYSMRSPEVTRLYLQVPPDTDLNDWSDSRIWDELGTRLSAEGFTLNEGPVMEKGVTGMRSFVAEPMRHGRLFLAGDAAHIVPPTGAKGMNLADRGCARAGRGTHVVLRERRRDGSRRLLGHVPAPRLAGRALLVVDDVDAAQRAPMATRSPDGSQTAQLRLHASLPAPRPPASPRTTPVCPHGGMA